MNVFKVLCRISGLENLRFDPVELDLHPVGNAAMGERLGQRLVGVLQPGVFAHNGNRDLAFRVLHRFGHALPAPHVGFGRRLDTKRRQHLAVQPRRMVSPWNIID